MAQATHPLVTIITPCYNLGHYLPETIESILSQDYPNIEYIVLDDGSSDNTREVLEQYTGKFHWETHANMGEARTVNKGWAMAKGDYVVVVNADDPLRPGMVSTLVKFMEENPEILVVYPDWIEIDENSQPMHRVDALDHDYHHTLTHAHCVPGPGAMIRRRGLELENARDTRYRYVTDMEYWMRLGLHGPFARYPEPLATHRTHPTSSGVAQKLAVGREVVTLMEEFFSRPDLPEDIKALRAAGVSAGYFSGGVRAPTYAEQRALFWKSFKLDPKSWLNLKERPPWVWSVLILPEVMSKFIWVVFHPVEYVRNKLKKAQHRTPQGTKDTRKL